MASVESVVLPTVSPEIPQVDLRPLSFPQNLAMLTAFLTTLPDVAPCTFPATPACLFHLAAQQLPVPFNLNTST